MTRTLRSIFAGLAAALLLGTSPAAAGEIRSVDISGKWRINRDLSDDPREAMQKKTQEMRGGRNGDFGGGGRGDAFGGGRGGKPGGGGGRGEGAVTREQMQARFRQLEERRREIEILQEGDNVTMIYASGDTIAVAPDGEKHKHQTWAGEVETEARWKDLALEVKTKGSQGAEMTRVYRISDDGRLEVAVLIELPRSNEKVEIVTVYDDVSNE